MSVSDERGVVVSVCVTFTHTLTRSSSPTDSWETDGRRDSTTRFYSATTDGGRRAASEFHILLFERPLPLATQQEEEDQEKIKREENSIRTIIKVSDIFSYWIVGDDTSKCHVVVTLHRRLLCFSSVIYWHLMIVNKEHKPFYWCHKRHCCSRISESLGIWFVFCSVWPLFFSFSFCQLFAVSCTVCWT